MLRGEEGRLCADHTHSLRGDSYDHRLDDDDDDDDDGVTIESEDSNGDDKDPDYDESSFNQGSSSRIRSVRLKSFFS